MTAKPPRAMGYTTTSSLNKPTSTTAGGFVASEHDIHLLHSLQAILATAGGCQLSDPLAIPGMNNNPNNLPAFVSLPIIVFRCLLDSVRTSNSSTFQEFMSEVGRNVDSLRSSSYNTISMIAGSGLFVRWISRQHFIKDEGFEAWRGRVLEYGARMVKSCYDFRDSAATRGLLFIKDDQTILVHSYSRAVMALLLKATAENKRFNVLVTEARPDCLGKRVVSELRSAGIPAALIHDAAVGHVIDKVDLVLVGCEAVVQNGGIINQIGTFQAAVVAKAVNKPFYVVAESYKFIQTFPLNQSDLPIPQPSYFPANMMKRDLASESSVESNIVTSNPTIDYTPPEYITLLFTNIGVLTPTAISEQLIMNM